MTTPSGQPRPAVLFGMVLAIATSGLVYELGMAAVGSYLLGDTVHQFSIVIGVYLSALGLGAYLSRFVRKRLGLVFIDVELATALVGGLSAELLLASFGWVGAWQPFFYATVSLVGVLVGIELPLLIRVLEHRLELRELIAKALTFDYIGALLGSLAFSLLLLPRLGLARASLASGLINALVGLASTWAFKGLADASSVQLTRARVRAFAVLFLLALGWVHSERATELSDAAVHSGHVLYAEQSRYQRIVVSESGGDVRLYLNGHLQFSSRDEARYHEALVHPALASATTRARVLIGGGGDGLAAREVLRWADVRELTLVDLDPRMTELFAHDPRLTALNRGSLSSPRMHVVNDDALSYLRRTNAEFDAVILDFPDPTNYAVGKLYSLEFYRALAKRLRHDAVVVVQATSPLFARSAFWCIERTIQSAGFHTLPYHVLVPSFGEWGFILARRSELEIPTEIRVTGLSYLDAARLAAMFVFPADSSKLEVAVNRIDNQALVGYYDADWERWN